MDLIDFEKGHAYIVGLHFCFPPRYARFKETDPSGWTWTDELTKAETFATKRQAERHMRGAMKKLIAEDRRVQVLKVEMKVGPA